MIQAFRFIEISKYDDGGQLMTAANLCLEAVYTIQGAVFPEPCFSGGQLTPAFENRGSMQIFEGQLGLTPSS